VQYPVDIYKIDLPWENHAVSEENNIFKP